MIYHDQAAPPARVEPWPVGSAVLAACGALGLVLVLGLGSERAFVVLWPALAIGAGSGLWRGRGLVRFRAWSTTAWVLLGAALVCVPLGLRAAAWALLWPAVGVAVALHAGGLAWPPRRRTFRARLVLPWASLVLACASCELFQPQAWLRGLVLGGGLFALSLPRLLPAPSTALFEGTERACRRAPCPRCGVRVDWPLDHPGVCPECGLKRRLESV